jgi:hypothetical protein
MTGTTSAVDLLDQCRQRGITLYCDGAELRFRGPTGAMTPELRQALAGRRADVQSLLRRASERAPAPAPRQRFAPSYLPCVCPSAVCWPCCNRPCEVCGRPTTSAFIRRCLLCENLPDPAETQGATS